MLINIQQIYVVISQQITFLVLRINTLQNSLQMFIEYLDFSTRRTINYSYHCIWSWLKIRDRKQALVTAGARTSAAMVLTQLSRNILASPPEVLMCPTGIYFLQLIVCLFSGHSTLVQSDRTQVADRVTEVPVGYIDAMNYNWIDVLKIFE